MMGVFAGYSAVHFYFPFRLGGESRSIARFFPVGWAEQSEAQHFDVRHTTINFQRAHWRVYWFACGTPQHCFSPLLASHFSLLGQRKVTKRKATPESQPAKKTGRFPRRP